MKNNILSIGQILYLSDETIPSPEDNIYIVQKGDTLYSIAINNNITVEQLKEMNNLSNNTLSIGQELIIPTPNNQEEMIEDNYSLYTVKKGDSLWKIAKEYNIPVTDLINLNNLSNLILQIGQQLLVPRTEFIIDNKEDTYIVQKGDTLWSVAKEKGIELDTLKELNDLTNNLLKIGQVLKLK